MEVPCEFVMDYQNYRPGLEVLFFIFSQLSRRRETIFFSTQACQYLQRKRVVRIEILNCEKIMTFHSRISTALIWHRYPLLINHHPQKNNGYCDHKIDRQVCHFVKMNFWIQKKNGTSKKILSFIKKLPNLLRSLNCRKQLSTN